MLTSIATVSISGTLESKLQAVAASGFDGVEIFENDLLAFPGSAAEVGRMIADLGLTCTLFQPFRDFEGLPDDLRARALDRAERKFDVMQDLGTDLLLVCSSVAPAASGDHGRIVDDFRALGDRAARRGLRIGYEALAWGRHVWDHRQAWEIVRRVGHPAIGLILDSFHSLVREIPIETISDIDPAKIFIVQLADAPWLQMDYLSWSRHFRNMPGQGDIPVRKFVSALLDIGYRGPLSLEIFNDRFRAMPASVVALDGFRALRLSVDEGARAIGIEVPPALPPRVRCRGFEFLEFAVSDQEQQDFSAMLATLGFAETGRHRSKAVTRWQQGRINIVLNADPDGFAHSYNVVHGPGLCAMCLRVDDVAGAVERARGLAIHAFEGRIGRGEMPVQAIRDEGGGLLYLVGDGDQDEMWNRDFAPVATALSSSGAGLIDVDHVAYAMRDQEIPTWVLAYFAFFDVEKKVGGEVPDPLGLVQTQPVESPDRAFRLLLSGSSGPDTLSSRLLQRYWGAGVQYVSLRTGDIFAAAERLRALGTEMLPIPANYYDDLEVRFALDPALVARLAVHDILYDRDDRGEYFQLATRAFGKRFFFEIVERRGGYDEYGAANEVIRLAAQSRFKDEPEI
ncbi:bifunctional sugar phosphate isomerase/epimerase/4-hydroxyphenylpyruvate dioxygenase family protein [Allosphingosinicella deserti]|uniref:3-dehydroshikimate dehydratase n=1 Tax=Allosphingosinicella deserti TaxID=2116704 RepID=A0A2P7QVM9_9SPHN|nr:sugar phosphate isomerase/epimerase and 4-hydroxyphenylpyruvate domain-containing protein [Sphingomonas deserti]PSJ42016.1 3-keto-5-aminohexanoate cleavage protein [Sphingomonas deserti]